tara:strand:- start:122 stop:388 length:267 start_codon:yes stop_codon:yes gene_type:complete
MLKSNDIQSYWDIDRMYDDNFESIEYFRLKMNGDIQIWKTYETKSEIWGLYEVIDTKNGNSRLYTRFIDAMSMGLLYYLQREGVINAT